MSLLTKIIFIIAFFSLSSAYSQSKFGFTAGYVNGFAKAVSFGDKATDSESGFYAGVILDNTASEAVHVVAELTYMNINDISFLQLPLLAKIYISNSPFNIQGGLQLTYTLEEVFDDFTKFNIGIGGGFGYDIGEHFFAETRYIFQLNDYFTGPDEILESKINFFNIGLGYKF